MAFTAKWNRLIHGNRFHFLVAYNRNRRPPVPPDEKGHLKASRVIGLLSARLTDYPSGQSPKAPQHDQAASSKQRVFKA